MPRCEIQCSRVPPIYPCQNEPAIFAFDCILQQIMHDHMNDVIICIHQCHLILIHHECENDRCLCAYYRDVACQISCHCCDHVMLPGTLTRATIRTPHAVVQHACNSGADYFGFFCLSVFLNFLSCLLFFFAFVCC